MRRNGGRKNDKKIATREQKSTHSTIFNLAWRNRRLPSSRSPPPRLISLSVRLWVDTFNYSAENLLIPTIKAWNILKKLWIDVNNLTAIRVLAGTKNSRPIGFYCRNITKSTVNPNTTIHKYDDHGGAVCHSYGVGSMDPPDRTRRPSSEGVGRGLVEANIINH